MLLSASTNSSRETAAKENTRSQWIPAASSQGLRAEGHSAPWQPLFRAADWSLRRLVAHDCEGRQLVVSGCLMARPAWLLPKDHAPFAAVHPAFGIHIASSRFEPPASVLRPSHSPTGPSQSSRPTALHPATCVNWRNTGGLIPSLRSYVIPSIRKPEGTFRGGHRVRSSILGFEGLVSGWLQNRTMPTSRLVDTEPDRRP
jgi:hypothetical protein